MSVKENFININFRTFDIFPLKKKTKNKLNYVVVGGVEQVSDVTYIVVNYVSEDLPVPHKQRPGYVYKNGVKKEDRFTETELINMIDLTVKYKVGDKFKSHMFSYEIVEPAELCFFYKCKIEGWHGRSVDLVNQYFLDIAEVIAKENVTKETIRNLIGGNNAN